MKVRIVIVAVLGIALAAYLVMSAGLNSVFSAAVAIGWTGFAILYLYALGLFIVLGAAWYSLVPGSPSAGLRVFIWARMVRDAATEVLPFSHVGGIVLGARAAMMQGVSRPATFASMIADFTTEMLAQFAFVALGVAILSIYAPRNSVSASVITASLIGLAVASAGVGMILVLRRRGTWIAGKIAGRIFPEAVVAGAAVGAILEQIHRSPRRLGWSLVLHFAGWVASAVGAWIAFRLMGARVDLVSVLSLESLVYAMRSAAFLIPNAIGVQEAAYAVLAPLFGVGAEFGLGVSLLKRARDVAVGVPILLLWQGMEGRRALARLR